MKNLPQTGLIKQNLRNVVFVKYAHGKRNAKKYGSKKII